MYTQTEPVVRPSMTGSLRAGLITGLGAAVINNIYYGLFGAISGLSYPEITLVSVTLASLLPNLVGALVFYALFVLRFVPQPATLFTIGALVLGALSCGGNLFAPPHPNPGFALATVPMHLVAAAAAAFYIPRLAARGGR